MTTKSEILRRLPAFTNNKTVIVKDQNTDEIIREILKAHELYKNDYNKICSLFYTGDEINTARKAFNYIKKNIKYVIEKDDQQMIKSPAAIFATPSSDCKNYALAINGILDSCRRLYGMNCDLYYRFAAYDGSNTPQHVFAVMVTNDGQEIWIDPVLDEFNEDKRPNFYKDKKIKNMALMALSGIDPYGNYGSPQNTTMGIIPLPPKLNLSNASGLNVKPLGSNLSNMLSGGISNLLSGGLAQTALSFLPGGPIVAQILPQLEKIFPNIKKTNPLEDPANTESGRRLYLSMYPDVAASQYGSQPFKHFAEHGHREGRYWIENPSVTKETIDDYYTRYPDVKQGYSSSVLQHYINYGQKEGRTIKLALTPDQQTQINVATGASAYIPPQSPLLPGQQNIIPGSQTLQPRQAGMSPIIILALVGAGAAIFLSKKK